MSSGPTNTIKRIKWRVEWLAQVSAEAVIARLPSGWVFRFGEGVGRLLWRTMRLRRRTVIKNLRIALAGEMPMEEIRELARESFIRSVANLVSAVHTAQLPGAVLESRVTVENPEVLEAAVRDGRGCLLLPPHMGNWEILSRINRLFPKGRIIGALYRPLNNPYLDARLAQRRESEGTRTFSKRDSLLAISRFVKDGGIIGVLADQRAGWQGVCTNFFGRLTRSTPLPSLLMRRCKVPAVAISVKTTSPGHWSVRYHRVPDAADVQTCMDTIELAMRVSLVDVFWFQDRWKCYVGRGKTLCDWLGDSEKRSTKNRHRAMIWLQGAPGDWEPPADWCHPDVEIELALGDGQAVPLWATSQTVVHRVTDSVKRSVLRKHLASIDKAADLPLDFVASPRSNRTLRAACRREGQYFVLIKNS